MNIGYLLIAYGAGCWTVLMIWLLSENVGKSKMMWVLRFSFLGWNVQFAPNVVRWVYRIHRYQRRVAAEGNLTFCRKFNIQRCFYDATQDRWLHGLAFGPLLIWKPADEATAIRLLGLKAKVAS